MESRGSVWCGWKQAVVGVGDRAGIVVVGSVKSVKNVLYVKKLAFSLVLQVTR